MTRPSFSLGASLAFFVTGMTGCSTNTMPTPAQLDRLEREVRATHQEQYDELARQRSSGQLSLDQYQNSLSILDQKVRNKVDTMVWSRHQLAQSELKSLGIPTPDAPVQIEPPLAGQVNGSLYSSSRINGLGNQIQGNFMRDMGGGNFNNGRRAGTIYDAQ
jgi:hypothetical protein